MLKILMMTIIVGLLLYNINKFLNKQLEKTPEQFQKDGMAKINSYTNFMENLTEKVRRK